jgi:thioredoxin
VHTCATCDGALYKGRPVAVVGGGDAAIVEAYHLAKLASKVTLIVRGPALKSIEEKRKLNLLSLPNVEVLYGTKIKEIVGAEDKITHLILTKNGSKQETKIPVDGLFLAIGTKPNTELFAKQIELDNRGYVVLKKDQSTSLPGVFAIGDVSDPVYRQAITAAGDGAKAALQVESYLAGTKSLTSPKPRAFQSTKNTALSPGHRDPHIVQIKSAEQFQREVVESDIPVIVDFYADWCGPCRTLGPHIEIWSQQFKGKVKFAKVNVDHQQKLAQRYRIAALPTVLYFETGGKLKESRTGTQEIAQLMQKLEENLKTTAAAP